MKGDFSRLTFDASRRYTRVLMQQGRVQLDADWNERQDIDRYAERSALQAVLGTAGVPAGANGFAVGLTGDGTDLQVSPGSLYVDGLLCENDGVVTLSGQPDLPVAADGLTGLVPATQPGRYLAYLDVWERDVSVLQDPTIRETALGGPDTATRTRLVWQVRLQRVGFDAAAEDFPPGWMPPEFAGLPGGQMAAKTQAAGAGSVCTLPPSASYTSLSNQLYRVEIHHGGWLGDGSADQPSFKWSRDNGSVAAAVTLVSGQAITVADLGPDDQLSFKPGQVVEILDGRMELAQQRGALLLIDSIAADANVISIDPATVVPPLDAGPLLLRRWDQAAAADDASGVALGGADIPLEAGITVSFTPGYYRSGDWWTFAARTAIDSSTGNILWPAAPGVPLPPQGTPHHYAPLALVQLDALPAPVFSLVEDCRALFAPTAGRLPPFRARWSKDGRLVELVAGQGVPIDAFGQGIMLATAAALDPTALTPASVRLVADLPVTMSQVIPASGDLRVVGTQEVALAADLALATANRVVITPRQPAWDLVTASLGGKLAGASQADFTHQFSTADFTPTAGQWLVQGDGSLLQGAAQAGTTLSGGSSVPGLPALALSLAAQDAPVLHAGVSFAAGPTPGDAGLVFNWSSNANFWVFYNTFYYQVIGFSGAIPLMAFGLAHYFNGQINIAASITSVIAMRSDAAGHVMSWRADLDITATGGGLAYGAKITWQDGQAQTFTLPFAPQTVTTAAPATATATATAAAPGRVVSATPIDIAPTAAELPTALQATDVARYRNIAASPALLASPALKPVLTTVRPSVPISQAVIGQPIVGAPTVAQPAAAATTVTYPLPTVIATGTRLGLMTRGKGDAAFTRLQWTNAADESVTVLPFGTSTPVPVRLIVKRSLLRTAAEGQARAEGGLPFVPAPEPDFETWFMVTANPPAPSGVYYGFSGASVLSSANLAGIGTERL